MIELAEAARNGDKQAFFSLIEQHKQCLYKIARTYFSDQMDIDDAIAETVFTCWKSVQLLREPKCFTSWIIKIHVNNCIAMSKQKGQYVSLDSLEEYEQPYTNDETDSVSDIIMLADRRYQPVLQLFYGEGFKAREISTILHIPEGTVLSHLKRGREQLAKRLGKEDLL